ncbi:copper chaperone PCu(A)C [Sphingomonas sp. AP4-R1]|uniref:copper chaperone PCu(A)C n=1 Tax=Sphingomonas sp. AP4-R1 TaxID=2735134 RepID=UPI0014933610|nr:copper chaperone PCu(A)C [Sphingomonas sp. AP4-R1]QJU56586.1 copper chaperone PCu(A)C [Sphingomonas sp. AP4-R1]
MTRIALLAAALAPLALLGGCDGHPAEPKVTHAWVRLPAVPGRPAAAYFTVSGGRADETLVRVESALAKRIEMHESMGTGGMAMMKPLPSLPLPARSDTRFAPGGKHLMLFDVDPVVTPGTAIPIRFGFASGKTAEAEAKTVAAGDDAPY